MLDHRTAARGFLPHVERWPRAASFNTFLLTDGSRAFRLRFTIGGRRLSVVLHEWPDCTCGCGGGWDEYLAYVELLCLRVQTWTPSQRGEHG